LHISESSGAYPKVWTRVLSRREDTGCRQYCRARVVVDTVAQFDFFTALVYADTRKNYGETRYIGVGHIGKRLHVVVFTETDSGIRVISLRKANERKIKAYEAR